MTKYSHLLGICCALLLGGCQTVEQLSIDYMLPAEVSFPPSLKRVAVVNNMPSIQAFDKTFHFTFTEGTFAGNHIIGP